MYSAKQLRDAIDAAFQQIVAAEGGHPILVAAWQHARTELLNALQSRGIPVNSEAKPAPGAQSATQQGQQGQQLSGIDAAEVQRQFDDLRAQVTQLKNDKQEENNA